MKLYTGTFRLQSAKRFSGSIIAASPKTQLNHLNPALSITIVQRSLTEVCFIYSAFSSCPSVISRSSLSRSPFSFTESKSSLMQPKRLPRVLFMFRRVNPITTQLPSHSTDVAVSVVSLALYAFDTPFFPVSLVLHSKHLSP
jgi:hypothetical protein